MNFVVRTPLRLNLENPEQAEIYQVMKNLNRDIYKSQNQFIVEALKHYINYSGADTLTEQEESEKRKYVTVEEQELMKEELKEEFYLPKQSGFLVPYLEGIQQDLKMRD